MSDEDLLQDPFEFRGQAHSVVATPSSSRSSSLTQKHAAYDSEVNETTSLLHSPGSSTVGYSTPPSARSETSNAIASDQSTPFIPGHRRSEIHDGLLAANFGLSQSDPGSRADSWNHGMDSPSILAASHESLWYKQFATIDWVQDNIKDAKRQKKLANLPGSRGRLVAWGQSAQGWFVAALIGVSVAIMAYAIEILEPWLFDIKFGYCQSAWYRPERRCCAGQIECNDWISWGTKLSLRDSKKHLFEFALYVAFTVILAALSCILAIRLKLQGPLNHSSHRQDDDQDTFIDPLTYKSKETGIPTPQALTYPATGSGIAEIRVIISGFVLHGYLGAATLFVKGFSLILSVAAGLSVGKEGPFVHMACAIANIISRLSPEFRHNDGKRREMLSAGAASGIAVAFGAPISGVLFALEEISYYFPSRMLFRTFFASITAAISLKFLDPYGTSKIVLFKVQYSKDWYSFELGLFLMLGVLGGALGAVFIKATRFWTRKFRSIRLVKSSPMAEVVFIALLTGLTTFWNRYTRKPAAELMYELSSDCHQSISSTGLCPQREEISTDLSQLAVALIIKAILTTITFGIQVPAGIYIPSMILGGLLGRFIGETTQYVITTHIHTSTLSNSGTVPGVVPGVYSLIAAAATMCGVTRLTITIVVMMFELSGSLDYVLPFSIAVLAAKGTADAIEPLSIYDLLTETNEYPFLDNNVCPKTLSGTLTDITTYYHGKHSLDISDSPFFKASTLCTKLSLVRDRGELDGGLPIIRHAILVGLVPVQNLEITLNRLARDHGGEDFACLMAREGTSPADGVSESRWDLADLSGLIDPAPIALDIDSSMELVYECFVKLGLRHICVLREGRYYGMVHKKAFVRHIRQRH